MSEGVISVAACIKSSGKQHKLLYSLHGLLNEGDMNATCLVTGSDTPAVGFLGKQNAVCGRWLSRADHSHAFSACSISAARRGRFE